MELLPSIGVIFRVYRTLRVTTISVAGKAAISKQNRQNEHGRDQTAKYAQRQHLAQAPQSLMRRDHHATEANHRRRRCQKDRRGRGIRDLIAQALAESIVNDVNAIVDPDS